MSHDPRRFERSNLAQSTRRPPISRAYDLTETKLSGYLGSDPLNPNPALLQTPLPSGIVAESPCGHFLLNRSITKHFLLNRSIRADLQNLTNQRGGIVARTHLLIASLVSSFPIPTEAVRLFCCVKCERPSVGEVTTRYAKPVAFVNNSVRIYQSIWKNVEMFK